MRSLYFLLSLFVAVFSSMAVVQADDDDPTVIIITDGGSNSGGPFSHAPVMLPIEGVYYSATSSIIITYLANLGQVTVEIENQTTGEHNLSVVNALAGTMPFIISGAPGCWTITFSLSSGTVYSGYFQIIN